MKDVWKWLGVHKKLFLPSHYVWYVAWCVLMVFCYVGKARADTLPYGNVPTITEWELTGIEANGTDYLVAGTNATLKITLGGCHLDWTQEDWGLGGDLGEEVVSVKHEFTQVLLVATGVTKPDGKVVYGFGRTDPNATYGGYDIFSYDGTDVFHVMGGIDLSGYQKVLVSSSLPAWSVSDLSSTSVVITLSVPLLPGADMHGKFRFALGVSYNEFLRYNIAEEVSEQVTSLGALFADSSTSVVEKPIFFDKYGQDFPGEGPNWFVYWREDGACPSMKERYEYMPSLIWRLFGGHGLGYDIYNRAESYGSAYGDCNPNTGYVRLFQDAPNQHYSSVYRVIDGKGNAHKFGGPSVYGIYSVEEVIAHECMHKKIQDDYKKASGPDNDKNTKPPYNEKECCDHLTDEQERSYEYGFNTLDTDSFNIATIKGEKEYGLYGDEEFLCMIEGQKALTKPVEENDWAFPGHQSWLPPENEAARPTRKNVRYTSVVKSVNVAAEANTQEEEADDGIPSMEVKLDTFSIGGRNTEGRIKTLDARIVMTADGPIRGRIEAVVTDTNNHVAAYCQREVQIEAGDQNIDLVFDGKQIYASQIDGPYLFRAVSLTCDGKVEKTTAGIWDTFDCTLDYSHNDFVRDDAYILPKGVTERVTSDGIEFGVNVEINTPDDYQLLALVSTTNQETVAGVDVRDYFTSGTNCVKLVMSSEAIAESGLDGPYVIRSIRLLKGSRSVYGLRNLYTTRKVYIASLFDFDDPDNPFDPDSGDNPFADYVPPEPSDGDGESSVEEFPEVESDADVGNALSGTESALRENITTKEKYDAFRSWAQSVKRSDGSIAGVQVVKESTRVWLSFALGTDTLIGKDVTSDDVHIVSFQVEGGSDEMVSSSSRSPTFIFEVAIDGVKIGSGVVAEEILKSNLEKVLAVEGSTQLDATTFSSDNIEIVFEPPVDGRARFMATTPSRFGNTFFMRVKVR